MTGTRPACREPPSRPGAAGAAHYAGAMAQLRLALAQIDPTVGDLGGNAAAIRRWTAQAAGRGAHLVAFPEMVLTGYPVEDLALRASFVDASGPRSTQLAAELAADGLGDLPVVVGYLDHADERDAAGERTPAGRARRTRRGCCTAAGSGPLRQAPPAQLRRLRRVPHTSCRAPTDRRPGRTASTSPSRSARTCGRRAARSPSPARPAPSCCWCINGSPYERDKDDTRLELVARRAAEAGCALAYLNLVGGQDELVFDGDSLVVDADGTVLARGAAVRARTCWSSTSTSRRTHASRPGRPADGVVHVTLSDEPVAPYAPAPAPLAATAGPGRGGLRGAASSACATTSQERLPRRCVLGLSGGIDSALVATHRRPTPSAARTSSASRMPSRYSSEHSPRRRRRARPSGIGLRLPGRPDRADGRRVPGRRSG